MSYHWFEFAPGHGMYDEVVNKLNQPAITPSWADPMVNWGINRPDFSSALNYGAMTQPDAIKQTWNFNVANQQQQQQQGQGQQGQRQQGQGQQGQRQQGQGQADRWGQDQGQGNSPEPLHFMKICVVVTRLFLTMHGLRRIQEYLH